MSVTFSWRPAFSSDSRPSVCPCHVRHALLTEWLLRVECMESGNITETWFCVLARSSQLSCMQVGVVNQARLSSAQLDPLTCQHSAAHGAGQALSHSFERFTHHRAHSNDAESIQAACRFELLAVKQPAAERCQDMAGQPCDEQPCFGRNYTAVATACGKTCNQCNVCQDSDDRCGAWQEEGACQLNALFMAGTCPAACGLCGVFYDPQPPLFVALWNGLLMPTVGFGTAGLGSLGESAVAMALANGAMLLDSAQGREWYREDLTGQVCLLLRAVHLARAWLPYTGSHR